VLSPEEIGAGVADGVADAGCGAGLFASAADAGEALITGDGAASGVAGAACCDAGMFASADGEVGFAVGEAMTAGGVALFGVAGAGCGGATAEESVADVVESVCCGVAA
jgi:hypothetical protein